MKKKNKNNCSRNSKGAYMNNLTIALFFICFLPVNAMRFSTCIENDKSLLSEIKDHKYSKISVDNNNFAVILKFKYLTF